MLWSMLWHTVRRRDSQTGTIRASLILRSCIGGYDPHTFGPSTLFHSLSDDCKGRLRRCLLLAALAALSTVAVRCVQAVVPQCALARHGNACSCTCSTLNQQDPLAASMPSGVHVVPGGVSCVHAFGKTVHVVHGRVANVSIMHMPVHKEHHK